MGKKKKDPVIEKYEKLKNEMIIEKVDEIFRTQPDNYISALEEIGFNYYDDDDDMEDLKISSALSLPITTMIYTHVLNHGGKGVKSPLDVGA